MAESYCLALMCKTPVPGQVKTRLIPALGELGACELHQRLLLHAYSKLQSFPVELWVTREAPWFSSHLKPCPQIYQQPAGDLGEKMRVICQHYTNQQISPILLGSDCPFIEESHIQQVLDALPVHDVVIIPAEDGGYVLLAVNATRNQSKHWFCLFENIDWGEPVVLQQTLQQAQESHLSVKLLEPLADIDRPEDLGKLHNTALLKGLSISRFD